MLVGSTILLCLDVGHLRRSWPLPVELSHGFHRMAPGKAQNPHNRRMPLPDHRLEDPGADGSADGRWPAAARQQTQTATIRSTGIPALPPHERPRERLVTLGATVLSDAELVAIQLGSGGPGESAVALAQSLLVEWGGVAGLARAAADELARRRGVGPAKAARLVAAFALADRVAGRPEGRVLRTTSDIAAVAAPLIGRERVEHVVLLIADHQQRVLRVLTVARGSATGCTAPVREILSLVLRHDGVAFALAHNHPGGTLDPSPQDIAVTARLRSAERELGLRLLDHVIVAGDEWRSITAAR